MSVVVLRCAVDGTLAAVVRDDLGLAATAIGRPWTELLATDDALSGLELLRAAVRDCAAAGRELGVRCAEGVRALAVAAATDGPDVLVVAAPTRHALRSVCDALVEAGDAAALTLRRRLRHADAPSGVDEEAFIELTRVNDELANLQREVARQSSQIRRASEEKARILGMAAHDLRSPLNGILLGARFLRERLGATTDGVEIEVLDSIERSGATMKRLIDDLLDTAALENGRPSLNPVPVALGPFLNEVVRFHAALARGRGVRVLLEADDPPTVRADEVRLGQILTNLISNAVDHTPGGGRVLVTATPRGREVEIVVADSGAGIHEDDVRHLFRPFSRGRKQRHGGTSVGLGLAICRRLVEAHGGTIRAGNLPTGGAAFRFVLPLDGSDDGSADGSR